MAARRSAAVLLGLPLVGAPPLVPQLVAAPLHRSDRASTRHERLASVAGGESVIVGQLTSTSPARTVVDLARSESFRSAVVVADGALRAGLLPEQLLAVAERCARWPGGSGGLRAARFADSRSESALESISRVAFYETGLPTPDCQTEIWYGGELAARVDFLWRSRLTIGEGDGRLKYELPQDLWAEKRREDRLRDLGFEVCRWGWDEAWNRPAVLAERVRAAMARSAGRSVHSDVRFIPARWGLPKVRAA